MNVEKMMDLSGKIVFLTGAAGLLGTQYSIALSKSGANVILADVNYSQCKKLENELKEKYPNVDFYSGIIYRALGFPTNMFTVMFALGRLPGWIAHWREMMLNPKNRINRPRQIYNGMQKRNPK